MAGMSNELKKRNILNLILIVRFACATLDVGHLIRRRHSYPYCSLPIFLSENFETKMPPIQPRVFLTPFRHPPAPGYPPVTHGPHPDIPIHLCISVLDGSGSPSRSNSSAGARRSTFRPCGSTVSPFRTAGRLGAIPEHRATSESAVAIGLLAVIAVAAPARRSLATATRDLRMPPIVC
jgi:hypothetical protein